MSVRAGSLCFLAILAVASCEDDDTELIQVMRVHGSRSRARAELRAVFAAMDSIQATDGKVTKSELMDFLGKAQLELTGRNLSIEVQQKAAEQVMQKFDTSGDGTISSDEWTMVAHQQLMQKRAREADALMETRTKEEVRRTLGMASEQTSEVRKLTQMTKELERLAAEREDPGEEGVRQEEVAVTANNVSDQVGGVMDDVNAVLNHKPSINDTLGEWVWGGVKLMLGRPFPSKHRIYCIFVETLPLIGDFSEEPNKCSKIAGPGKVAGYGDR